MENDTFTTYILDFDSTIIDCESLDELARIALASNPYQHEIMSELENFTRQGMAGVLPFNHSLEQRLKLFRASQEHIAILIKDLAHHITPSLLENKAWIAENKDHIYIISGGFEDYIKPIAVLLGLLPENVYANRFTFNTAGIVTGFDDSLLTSRADGKAAQAQALDLPHPLVAIGDGYTDYELKRAGAVDAFWAYAGHIARPEVIAEADRIIHSFSDITPLNTEELAPA